MKDYRANRDAARGQPARPRGRALTAVLVSLAAVVIVGPHYLRGSPTTNDATDPSNGIRAANAAGGGSAYPYVAPCPPRPTNLEALEPPVGDLATDAVAVRLCRAAVPGRVSPWSAPGDALVTDVDGFVAEVTGLAEPLERQCVKHSTGAPFVLTISYPVGRTVHLFGFSGPCSTVDVGDHDVAAGALLTTFERRLQRQRSVLGTLASQSAPR
jgi:hypothetical protein